MTKRGLTILVITVAAGWAYFRFNAPPIDHPPGQIAPDAPFQEPLPEELTFDHEGYTIAARAKFGVRARVLSTQRYRFDQGATLAPVDLALGWGPMSDSTNLARIRIRQSGRFYYWHAKSYPIPRRDIERNSANMHMIPADDNVATVLKDAREGHLLWLKGYLVRVTGQDGWRWKSSMTRDDTGDGACELVYVLEARLFMHPPN